MSIKRINLANAKQLSKSQMKKIKAGGPPANCNCNSKDDCSGSTPVCGNESCTKGTYQGVCDSQ